jgi:hypothetical protein
MKRLTVPVILTLLGVPAMLGFSTASPTLSLRGAVVAILKANEGVRVVDPTSAGDLAEVYMVRVDSAPSGNERKYILVEYNHRDGLIPYSQFDTFHWSLDVRQATLSQGNPCLDWLRPGLSFAPTRMANHSKLPDPRTLVCYVTTKRPFRFDELSEHMGLTCPLVRARDQPRQNKNPHVCPSFCLIKGVHPRTWEQIGNKTSQISAVFAIRAKRKGKTSHSLRD